MSETGMTRNPTMLRVFSLVMGLLALAGWGTFVYATRTSAAAQRQLQEQVAGLNAGRDQLTTERDEAKAQLIAA